MAKVSTFGGDAPGNAPREAPGDESTALILHRDHPPVTLTTLLPTCDATERDGAE